MTIKRLRELHRAEPFRPFMLRMADGTHLRVSHPEALAYIQLHRPHRRLRRP